MAQEFREGFQAARRGADADDGKCVGGLGRTFFPCRRGAARGRPTRRLFFSVSPGPGHRPTDAVETSASTTPRSISTGLRSGWVYYQQGTGGSKDTRLNRRLSGGGPDDDVPVRHWGL